MSCSVKSTLLATVMLVNIASAAQASIIISEVDPSSSGSGTVAADWFELTNTGLAPVNIGGWKMDDNSNSFASSVALLGLASIAPGQSVVFAETANLAATQAAFINAWFGGIAPLGFTMGSYSGAGVGLSTAGDAVNIFDSLGALQAKVIFGAATASKTFDNAQGLNNTTISQLSAVGVNGALLGSTDNRIGSPGTISTVPVPAAAWLLSSAFGVLGLIGRRRAI
jgi:hypothetical protein